MIYMLIFFIVSISYTFFGYPLLLKILSKKYKDNIRPSFKYTQPITVLLVVCNEEINISNKINNIFNFEYSKEKIKLIIVDDASDDNTVSIIESYNDSRITIIKNNMRSGKAYGINEGMKKDTDLVMLVDARQVINTTAMKDLASWFCPGNKVGAVSGEVKFRGHESGFESGMDAYQRYEKYIRKNESSISGVPGVSGAIYMLRKKLFEPIENDTVLDDVLIPMNVAKQGYWVGYDDRAIAWDIPSHDMAREKQRKTRTLKGNYQLLFRHLDWCVPGMHPLWFQYLSHKVSRLTAPFFALAVLFISIVMYFQGLEVFGMLSLCLLIGFSLYPLSILFPKINNFTILKIGSSFVALNWFNLLGFFQYFFGSDKQSWK